MTDDEEEMAPKTFSRSGKKVVNTERPGDSVTGVSDEDQLTYLGDRLFIEGIPLTYAEP